VNKFGNHSLEVATRPAHVLISVNSVTACACVRVYWLRLQSNFLHGFSALSPHKTKKLKTSSRSGHLHSLWLNVFVNLSFTTDGQTMILKIDGQFGT